MPERLHPTIAMMPDGAGKFCRYPDGGFAAGPWNNGTPPLMVWLVAQKNETSAPEIMRHDGTRFRSTTGADKGALVYRWAVISLVEEITETQPGPVQPASTGNWLQDLVNLLTKFYKWSDILNARDRSPYYNPEEGAPEE